MSRSARSNDKKPPAGGRLARHARGAADVSDRLLGILAQDIGEVGSWAIGQAQAVRGSLSAALGRTIEVTRGLRDQPNAAPSIGANVEEEQTLAGAGAPLDTLNLQSAGNLDLLPATQHPGATTLPTDEPELAAHASHSPGVRPVLEALERVVVEHSKSKTGSLDTDLRFWKLIELLQALKRAQPTAHSDCNARPQQRSDELDSR
jgi:hypothetical protein